MPKSRDLKSLWLNEDGDDSYQQPRVLKVRENASNEPKNNGYYYVASLLTKLGKFILLRLSCEKVAAQS
jgi:hypothetical protein